MSEPETIRLKKEVLGLKELNAQLLEENEELNNQIGQLQNSYKAFRNKGELINQAQLLAQNKEILRSNIEEAVLFEKTKMMKIQKENEELKQNLKLYQQKLKDNELFIQKIQLENKDLKKQLIEFENKHEGKDIIDNQRNRDDAIYKKEQDYQKITFEWNELKNKMEEVLSENRILRQMADVPENFGIDIAKIKMGDRIKIEDYRAKIRILQKEIDELETERAQLKHRLTFLSNVYLVKQEPFYLLTKEQKVEVAKFAQDLYEGKKYIEPERYELKNENLQLKNKISFLEDEIFKLKTGGNSYLYKNGKNNNMEDLIRSIVRETRNEISKTQKLNQNNDNENNLDENNTGKLRAANKKMQKLNTLESDGNYIDYNYLQYPPQAILKDPNSNEYDHALSYRLNSNYKIPADKIHELFGIAMDDQDYDALLKESASLQAQIIELLEIEFRRNNNDKLLNDNLKGIYNKLENLVLIQNEIFKRYMDEKKRNSEINEEERKKMDDLLAEINSNRRKIKSYDETLSIIEKKNPIELERKITEIIKENAILEDKNLKLFRKYQCLVEEEKKLREFIESHEQNNIEKDKKTKEIIIKLKAAKNLYLFYLRFLNDKLRKCVDKNDFDRIVQQNKYLRKRLNEMNKRDILLTKEMIMSHTLILRFKELENSYYFCEEEKLDAEIEVAVLKKRLQDCDPNYYNEQKAFRKLLHKLQDVTTSFDEIKKAFIISKKNSEESKDNENNKDKINLGESFSFLKDLTMDNSFITKKDFENCLIRLGISENDISQTDLQYIYFVLNCENDNTVDIRSFLKKLQLYSSKEASNKTNDELLFDRFIQCIKNSSQNLLEIFEYFDTNNNGSITREEFKFALQRLNFSLQDEDIDKLIILVTGRPEDEFKLDHTDTFNYIEFCELFEQKSKNHLLRRRKINNNKNLITIDRKFNLLGTIVIGIEKCRVSIDDVFLGSDKTHKGFITYDEFLNVLNSCDVNMSSNDSKDLYDMFDFSKQNLIPLDNFISSLKMAQKDILNYNQMTNIVKSETSMKIDYAKKYTLLNEEKQYFNIKMNTMQKRLEELERNNTDLAKNLESYATKNTDLVQKYFSTLEELNQFKETYVNIAVKRDDLQRIEYENDSLSREVTILRIGLNTFKELYNSSNLQIKSITINTEKNKDELDTYKRAIKELQSENDQNALIGRLYYTLLISRWREADTLKKYDDFVTDFTTLKEDNFQLETQNKNLTKDLTDVQVALNDKIIENTRMIDRLEDYENGLIAFNSSNIESHPNEEMNNLIEMLSEDKKKITENMIKLKKVVLKLENENDTLKNKIDFCESLANKIRFNNRDEYSKKLIQMCEEISQLKLDNNVLKRENNFEKESENYLKNINNELTNDIKKYERENVEWENKYRKMQELYRTKDEERQKKILNSLEKMKMFDQNQLRIILNEKSPYGDKYISNINTLEGKPPVLTPDEYEKKIKQLNTIIKLKTNEIEKLSKINNENAQLIKESDNYYGINNNLQMNNNIPNLLDNQNYDIYKDDETKNIAKTAHKTIKTLQDLLSQKNDIINKKDIQIDNLRNELRNVKEEDLKRINDLEDQVRNGHESSMKKLQNIIDTTNSNLVVKLTKNDLAIMNLDDIEKIINDKDNTIKALGLELKAIKEENDVNYLQINEKNKKIAELENNLRYQQVNNQGLFNTDTNSLLRRQLEEKNKEIQEEREKNERLRQEFVKRINDKKLADENAKLDSTLFVPERLVVNKEKSDLYVKIDQLRVENRKLIDLKKKLLEKLKQRDEEIKNLTDKLNKEKEREKQIMESQIKDTKRISQLKKEKEKLEKNNDKFKEDLDKLKLKIIELEEENKKNSSSSNLRARPQTSINRRTNNNNNNNFNRNQNLMDSNIRSSNIINDNQNDLPIINNKYNNNLSQDDLIKRLIYFCLNNNIILSKQFQRYDISKDGKIKENDFKDAIEKLNAGFIESELGDLVKMSNPDSNKYIKYMNFIKLMTDKNDNYKNIEKPSQNENNKAPTKKYNPLENKEFNINY